jgi:transposase
MAKLSKIVRDKNPLQLGFPFALWTIAMIREVVQRQFGVRLSEVSVGRLLKTLGFTPQRPLHRAWQQDPVLVEQWTTREYPKIQALAKREKAEIFFGDEAGIRSDHHAGTTWSPKGSTPIVKSTGARFGLNMLSAISPRGELRFMVVEGGVTAAVFVTFLKRLVEGAVRPIFLIVDGHPTHKSKAAKKFVESTNGMLRLFLLPPYSPELNADELVWGHVKGRVGRQLVASKEELKSKVIGVLRHLQKSTQKVANFFLTPTCRYAAA